MNWFLFVPFVTSLIFSYPNEKSHQLEASQSGFEPLIVQDIVFNNKILPIASTTSRIPVHIKVSGTTIDLPVKVAKVLANQYDFFANEASYLEISAAPGEGGNTVIYAHNQEILFQPLHEVALGQEIILNTNDDKYRYLVIEKKIVDPNDITVILPTENEQLTLLTCTDDKSKRLIVVAAPIATFGQLLASSTPGVY